MSKIFLVYQLINFKWLVTSPPFVLSVASETSKVEGWQKSLASVLRLRLQTFGLQPTLRTNGKGKGSREIKKKRLVTLPPISLNKAIEFAAVYQGHSIFGESVSRA